MRQQILTGNQTGTLGHPGQHLVWGRERSRGQVLVIFALSAFVLVGMCAVVIDVAWFWANTLRVQRAADAAALAGAVVLPGDVPKAVSLAKAEAAKNGYLTGVTPCSDANLPVGCTGGLGNDKQLNVTVTASVPTFFMRVFGINSIQATRTAKAQFVLPVPMGSPDNFYGVYCLTTPTNLNCPINTAVTGADGTTVYSRGAWGAIQATGTDHGQGDAFIPLNDPTRSLGTNGAGGTNPDFDPGGYNYAVELPAGGSIYVFDPTACAVGDQTGTGDHWNDSNPAYSVSTFYDLYNATQYPTDFTKQPLVASSGTLFKQEYQYDKSKKYGTPGYVGSIKSTSKDGITLVDCSEGKIPSESVGGHWHDLWWPVGKGVPAGSPGVATGLPAGTYRLNIRSAPLGAPNQAATFENDWSIEAVGTGTGACSIPNCPRVYGLGRMATYNILPGSGKNTFYLAQIGAESAGKTLEIKLFDPGDVGGDAYLRILSPDGNKYSYSAFTYTADANCGQTRGSSDICPTPPNSTWVSRSGADPKIQAASSGNSSFNDSWITIRVKLPSTYGCSVLSPCLQPTSGPGVAIGGEQQQGWWKIEYETTSAANDTTTWRVNLLGNPVHLVVP